MPLRPPTRPLALLAGAVLALAGCGDDGEPAATAARTATAVETVTVPAAPGRTATAPRATTPAFAPVTLREAQAVLEENGYATLTQRDWRPDAGLKVLVGVRRGVSDRGAQQAFFFAGGRFIGTDASAPSGRIAVVGQASDAVTLAYALYRPGDAIERPTGGSAEVTFAWDGERLAPREPIPPADPGARRSRR